MHALNKVSMQLFDGELAVILGASGSGKSTLLNILGGEYRIEASIVVEELQDVILIPTSAIFQRNNAWYTFVVEQDEARLRQVEIGLRNQNFAQVLEMLEPGTQVILFPSDLINEGVSVVL